MSSPLSQAAIEPSTFRVRDFRPYRGEGNHSLIVRYSTDAIEAELGRRLADPGEAREMVEEAIEDWARHFRRYGKSQRSEIELEVSARCDGDRWPATLPKPDCGQCHGDGWILTGSTPIHSADKAWCPDCFPEHWREATDE